MKYQKNLMKLSCLLLDSLGKVKKQNLLEVQQSFEEFADKCYEMTKGLRQMRMAVKKNWLGAAETIKGRVGRNLNDFSHHLARFKELANADGISLPNLSDIYAELAQIALEFGEPKFDLDKRTLSVITGPITLEGVALGPFEIRLSIDCLSSHFRESPYRVIALDPNPASRNEEVTHPHVSSESLCEGDGHVAIRSAIEQGRFCDFFTLVVNILQTYNPDSPHISLDDWSGVSCYDCGCSMADDERYYCEHCDQDYCPNCSTCCQICDTTICLGCAYNCPSCNEPVCRNCTAICEDCEGTFCKDCLNEEGICQNCQEQRKENEDEEQEQLSEQPKADAEVQSDGVGEAIVLSRHD